MRFSPLLTLFLLALCAFGVSSCGVPPEEVRVPEYFASTGKPLTAREAIALETARRRALERGAVVYREACAPCHGRYGDGRGPAAAPLDPPPWDFTLGAFPRAESAADRLGEGIFRVISDGLPDAEMPAFGKLLSQEDRWAVVVFIEELAGLGP